MITVFKIFLFFIVILLAGPGNASENHIFTDTHIYTPIGLKPIQDSDASYQLARVCFVPNGTCGTESTDSDDYNVKGQCAKNGFTIQSCSSSFSVLSASGISSEPSGECGLESGYYKECCLSSSVTEKSCTGGTYAANTCAATGNKICVCSPSTYKYIADAADIPSGGVYSGQVQSCGQPKILKGKSCIGNNFFKSGGRLNATSKVILYSDCGCPDNYTETCVNNQVGVGEECDGKYQACKCPENYRDCDYGPAVNASSCTIDGVTTYNECKSVADYCSEQGYTSNICTAGEAEKFGSDYYCPASTQYCKASCRTELLTSGKFAEDTNGTIYSLSNKAEAYIIEDGKMPFQNTSWKDAACSDYRYVYGPSKLTAYPACASLSKPTVTASSVESAYLLNKSIDGVNVMPSGSNEFLVDFQAKWDNVTFKDTGTVVILDKGSITMGTGASSATNKGFVFKVYDGGTFNVNGLTSGNPVYKAKTIAVWGSAAATLSGNIKYGDLDSSSVYLTLKSGTYEGPIVAHAGRISFGSGVKINGTVTVDNANVGNGAATKVTVSKGATLSTLYIKDGAEGDLTGGTISTLDISNTSVVQIHPYSSGDLKISTLNVGECSSAHVTKDATLGGTINLNQNNTSVKGPANLFIYHMAILDVNRVNINPSGKVRLQGHSQLYTNYMSMCYQNDGGWRTQICFGRKLSDGWEPRIKYSGQWTEGSTRNVRAGKNCSISPGFGTSNSSDNSYYDCDWDNKHGNCGGSSSSWSYSSIKSCYLCQY